MRCIEIPEANIKRYVPSDLSECDAKQYIDMCGLIFSFMCGQIEYDNLRVHAVYKLLQMKPVKENLSQIEDEKKHCNLFVLSELIDDFFEIDEKGQKIIKQNYLHNPVPYFAPAWKTYYGPSDQFMNVGFGEYLDALRLFFEFSASGDIELLYHIAAILYRPKKALHFLYKQTSNYDGDIRQAYNSNLVEKRAEALKAAPFGFVYGVYLYFASFQKFISTAEVSWGGKTLDLSILFTPDSNDEQIDVGKDDIGMDSIMFSMAESGTFGTRKELEQTNVWMILVRMYDIRLQDLKRKKQEENAEYNKTS
jgi:hypothetical protein